MIKPTANILNSEKQSIPSKIRNKTRVPTLASIIQHIFGSPSYGRKGKEKESRLEKKQNSHCR